MFAFARENETLAKLCLVPRHEDEISAFLREKLREWLRVEGNTQVMAAERAGVSPAQISNLLSGDRGAGMKTLRGLAKVLGLNFAEITAEAERLAASRPPAARRGVDAAPSRGGDRAPSREGP